MATHKERQVTQHVQKTSFTRVVTQVEQVCPVCQKRFWGARIRRYCSQPCRQKANYQRHQEQYRQVRMERYRAEKQGQEQ